MFDYYFQHTSNCNNLYSSAVNAISDYISHIFIFKAICGTEKICVKFYTHHFQVLAQKFPTTAKP